jgi:signal transduction histidine kinase
LFSHIFTVCAWAVQLALLSMLVHAFCINRQRSGDDSLKNFMNLLDSDMMLKAHELRTPLNGIIGTLRVMYNYDSNIQALSSPGTAGSSALQ